MNVPDRITCVDCGQPAHLLSVAPEEGWEVGDIIAYRCSGCHDRWDLVVEESDDHDSSAPRPPRPDGLPADFDFRIWLRDRSD